MWPVRVCVVTLVVAVFTCPTTVSAGTFGEDVEFLRKHTSVVILTDSERQSQAAVLPKLQGRVITSTAGGDKGLSFGWINRELIASGKTVEHMNAYGGEDRFWIGPEGGQFSVFFKAGVSFDLEHWFTPAPIDTEPFDPVSQTPTGIMLRKDIRLVNYSGTAFSLRVDREIRLLSVEDAARMLGIQPEKTVKIVAYESDNKMTNTGGAAWQKATGLLSIWILGMYNPSPATTVVVPFNVGREDDLGPIVNDAYFGKVPSDRLVVKDRVLFFRGDGQYRSKIGLSPQRAKDVAGSYDSLNRVLTIVQYNKPPNARDYVNSMWEIQKDPYKGDAVNSYNDGPATPGAKPLGPFYELETSSAAASLGPGQSITHIHRTYHLQGPEAQLNSVATQVLGVTLAEITAAFSK